MIKSRKTIQTQRFFLYIFLVFFVLMLPTKVFAIFSSRRTISSYANAVKLMSRGSRLTAVRQPTKRKRTATSTEIVTEVVGATVDEISPELRIFSKKKGNEQDAEAADRFTTSQSSATTNTDYLSSFIVFGEPMALARHRTTKFGIQYNPSAKFQKRFLELSKPYLPAVPFSGPIEAKLLFYIGRPKNHFGTGKNSHILKDGKGYWHDSRLGIKPLFIIFSYLHIRVDYFFSTFVFLLDLDNLVKFVLDALNGVAYEDDSQISSIICAKAYTSSIEDLPRIEIQFRRLSETDTISKEFFTVENHINPLTKQ